MAAMRADAVEDLHVAVLILDVELLATLLSEIVEYAHLACNQQNA